MKTLLLIIAGAFSAALLVGCSAVSSAKAQRGAGQAEQKTALPALPADVIELKFSEFFVTPIGPRGLTLTDKLTVLEGKRVRMLGYMVRQETGLPGEFLFTAMPVQVHEHDSSDDLPPAVVHVSVPTCRDRPIPYAPGLMLLTGTLSVGHREQADGRMSLVRLALEPPASGKPMFASAAKGAERLTQAGRNRSIPQ